MTTVLDQLQTISRDLDNAQTSRRVIFDAADAALVDQYNWRLLASKSPGLFYAVASIKTTEGEWKTIGMHNLLLGQLWVDHINGDGLDNRRANLRPASPSQNNANMRPRTGCSSKFKGVTWDKVNKRWLVRIQVRGKSRYLGIFKSEEDAARAYDAAALDAWGAYARLNFPVEVDS